MPNKEKPEEPASDEGTGVESVRTIRQKLVEKEDVRANLLEQTDAYIFDLAKRAAGDWYEENRFQLKNPKTWGRSVYTVAAAVLVVAFLMVLELANRDESFLQDWAHKILGTDAQVRLSRHTDVFDEAVLDSIRAYVSSDSSDNQNPMSSLVRRTMKNAPILVFHGRATFGDTRIVQATNAACTAFFEIYDIPLHAAKLDVERPSGEFGNLPPPIETQSIDISAICEPSFVLDVQQDVDIPFHARFFDTDHSKRHEVFVVLHVHRLNRSDNTPVGSVELVRNLQHGVCILYSAGKRWNQQGNANETIININSDFEYQGEGLFLAKLSDVVSENGGDQPPVYQGPRETLHSIALVSIAPSPNANPPDSLQEREENEACEDVAPNIDQIITIRAMVLVNLAPDNRS